MTSTVEMLRENDMRIQRHTVEYITQFTQRAQMAHYLHVLAMDGYPSDDDKLPSYVVPSSELYLYGRTYFEVSLDFTDEELAPVNDPDNHTPVQVKHAWRLRAQKIAYARMWFKIKKLTRSVHNNGDVEYSGEGKLPHHYQYNPNADQLYTITIKVPNGGLPPTCQIITEEVPYESKGTRTVVRTVCK